MRSAEQKRPFPTREIATPVCGLVRNDMGFSILRRGRLRHIGPRTSNARPYEGERRERIYALRGKRIATSRNDMGLRRLCYGLK